MKTFKYAFLLIAICLLGVSCSDDPETDQTEPPYVEGIDPKDPEPPGPGPEPEPVPEPAYDITVKVNSKAPSPVGSVSAADFTKKWITDDIVGAYAVSDDGTWAVINTNHIELKPAEGGSASVVFSAEEVEEGKYMIYYPYESATVATGDTGFDFAFPVTQTQKGTGSDHLTENYILVADKIIEVDEDYEEAEIEMQHIYAVLEIPMRLEFNSFDPIMVTKITLQGEDNQAVFGTTAQWRFNNGDGEITFSDVNKTSNLTLDVTDAPQLTTSGTFIARMYMPEIKAERLNVIVSTAEGSITSVINNVDYTPGNIYTAEELVFDPEDIQGKPVVNNAEEWEEAMVFAQQYGLADIILGADLTLNSSSTFPTIPLIVSGEGTTLTIDTDSGTLPSYGSAVTNASFYKELGFRSDVTLNGVNLNATGNGILTGKNITVSGNTSFNGGFRIVLDGELKVQNGGTAQITEYTILSCGKLTEEGSINNSGIVYYGDKSGSTVAGADPQERLLFAKEDIQMPNSGFEDWYYEYKESGIGSWKTYTRIWHVSKEEDIKGKHWWDTGNRGTGGSTGGSQSNTLQDDHSMRGYSAKLVSQVLNTTLGSKFGAGNLFVGTYDGLDIVNAGVKLKFGRKYDHLPVAITGYLDHITGPINHVDSKNTAHLEGQPDAYEVYIALSTKDFTVQTGVQGTYVINEENDDILAWGYISNNYTTGGYVPFRINLNYKESIENLPETVYILVTASSSYQGRYLTGSTSSVLYIDELQLEF